MQRIFAQHQIEPPERLPGIDGREVKVPSNWRYPPGVYGCLQSHLSVIGQAKKRRKPSVLIFEDDCIFCVDLNDKFRQYISELPSDWGLLFFGGRHKKEPQRVSDNIGKVVETWQSLCYAVNHTLYDALIEQCEETQEAIDHYLVALQGRFNCYCFMPSLVWQAGDDSDTQERDSGI
jgi:GR25 family glycosyltransferase involved in LPS biosynthesis